MTRYLRTVRRSRWAQPNWATGSTYEWQGDALGDLATAKNSLSVFLADSDDMVSYAVAALASKRSQLVNLDYAIIDSELLDKSKRERCTKTEKPLTDWRTSSTTT